MNGNRWKSEVVSETEYMGNKRKRPSLSDCSEHFINTPSFT